MKAFAVTKMNARATLKKWNYTKQHKVISLQC